MKFKLLLTIAGIYVVTGMVSFVAFLMVTDSVVHYLGTSFADKQALLEKARILSDLRRDLALSLKLADSPLLKRWADDERNPVLKKAALEELESYRSSFKDKSYFFVINASRHYYFNDSRGSYTANPLRYTLDSGNPSDAWYFRTLRDVSAYELNVDHDFHLNVTKVWFNAIVKDSSGRKIGLGGGGIDISQFIDAVLNSGDKGISTILFSGSGAIEGHRDRKYMEHNSAIRGGKKITIYDLMKYAPDVAELKEAMATLASGKEEVAHLNLTIDGKQYLAALGYLAEIRWYNLVLVDTTEVIKHRDFLPILVTTILSLLLVLVIIGFVTNRFMLRPLLALTASSREIARGNYDIQVPVLSTDEFGQLTESFNGMARTVRDYTENLEQKVRERTEALNLTNRQLEESNRHIMASIRYAEMIQSSLLPKQELMGRHIAGFFTLYLPRDIVGGDFYWFREARDGYLIAVIDCTGHGVPGAMMAMTANAVLNRVVENMPEAAPAVLLKELNRLMRETLHQDTCDTGVDNGLDMALCRVYPGERRLQFSGARLDLFAATGGDVTTIRGDRQAIGYRSSDVDHDYAETTLSLEENTSLFLASDGILDQAGGPKGFGFGRRRFCAILAEISGLPPERQRQRLIEVLDDYRAGIPQRDDITILGFRAI